LFALYISPVFHILENSLKNLKIPISILSFVDNGLFIAQSKYFTVSNSHLFYSYNIISSILDKFDLVLEHEKMEVFHFSRAQETFNPSPLDLSMISGPVLKPKDTWRYLGFIFNRKLSFHQHINFYANKAISTIKYMKSLATPYKALFLNRNDFFIEVVSSLLHYMGFNYGSTRKHHYHIHLEYSTTYNEELPFEFLACFVLLLLLVLKPLQGFFPLIFIFVNVVVELN